MNNIAYGACTRARCRRAHARCPRTTHRQSDGPLTAVRRCPITASRARDESAMLTHSTPAPTRRALSHTCAHGDTQPHGVMGWARALGSGIWGSTSSSPNNVISASGSACGTFRSTTSEPDSLHNLRFARPFASQLGLQSSQRRVGHALDQPLPCSACVRRHGSSHTRASCQLTTGLGFRVRPEQYASATGFLRGYGVSGFGYRLGT